MLHGTFFTITNLQSEANRLTATLHLDPTHPIFEGHFPGLPVVPGVCLLQLVKETLEDALNQETRLLSADPLKFLAVVNPLETTRLHLELTHRTDEAGDIRLDARLFVGATVYFKMKGRLRVTAAE